MKNFLILTLLFVGMPNGSDIYTDLKIYKSFIRGGTTAHICTEFHSTIRTDSSFVDISSIDFDINHIMNNAKCSNLYSQKIGGISCGGEINKNGEKHYIFVCLPDRIFDMTEWLIYNITDTTDMQMMSLLFRTESIPIELINCLTEMGQDTSSVLNTCESKYLNHVFLGKNKYRNVVFIDDSFDFNNKRILFFENDIRMTQIAKKEYFNKIKKGLTITRRFPSDIDELFVFDKEQAKQIGYDAAVVLGNKRYISKKNIMKNLKKH